MLYASRALRGAGRIGAAHRRRILVSTYGLAARGADARHVKIDLTAVSHFGMSAKHLGDNVTRLAYRDRVAELDLSFSYEIEIVKRRAADRRSRESDGEENSGRSQDTRAPNVFFSSGGNLYATAHFGVFVPSPRVFLSARSLILMTTPSMS